MTTPQVMPQTSTTLFPLDIDSIVATDLDVWQRAFFWPMSWPKFLGLEGRVTDVFDTAITQYQGMLLSDLLLIAYKHYLEYSNYLHELFVLEVLQQKGIRPLFGKACRYHHIAEHGIPDSSLGNGGFPTRRSFVHRHLSHLRILSRIRYPVQWLRWYGENGVAGFVTDASLSDYTLDYLRNSFSGRITFLPFENLVAGSVAPSQRERTQIRELSRELVEGVGRVACDYDISLTQQQCAYLEQATEQRLLTAHEVLCRIQKHSRPIPHDHLFLASNHHDFSRALSVITRRRGGKVTGFSHGEPLVYHWKKIAWMELALVDEYVEYSQELARQVSATLPRFPPPNRNRPMIFGSSYSWLRRLWRKQRKMPVPQKVERVMLIGNAYRESGLSCVTSFPAPVQFELELRLIRLLQGAGIRVLYKQHPGGLTPRLDFDFAVLGVEVVDGAFEDHLDRTDAFLFYHTRTTTIGTALCTRKPILIIDGGWERITPDLKSALEQRCEFIRGRFNDRNILEINEDRFMHLEQALEKADNADFAERFLGVA